MKFSIITPSFNQSDFIERTIKSVLTQKGDFEIEYIVMDGGSTDETVKILKDYESRVKNNEFENYNKGITFSWQSKKDKGQTYAIDEGLKKATGDILAYINSDDAYVPGAFEKVASAFETDKKKNWLTGYCNIVDGDDKPIRSIIASYKNFWLNHYSYNKLSVLNFVSQPATFWKKDVIDKFGYFDETLHYTMDYDYWLKIGKDNDPIILKTPLCDFRIHNQSKGETAFKKQFNQDFEVCKRYCKNKPLVFLHSIHNGLIKIAYSIIKN